MDLTTQIQTTPLVELAANAPAIVDELAVVAGLDDRELGLPTPCVVNRPPIRVGIVPDTAAPGALGLIAIVAVPGGRGDAIRWRRVRRTCHAVDSDGRELVDLPDYERVYRLGDARMLLTTVLRRIQRPAAAVVRSYELTANGAPAEIGSERYLLSAEATLGRTADRISDISFPSGCLSKVTWRYEWSDDAWWVRRFGHAGNITLNGKADWARAQLAHGDVVASGLFGVQFLAAD